MPRLLIFAAFDRILIDDQGVPSLIGLFTKAVATLPETENVNALPKNAVGPKEWGIFTLWQSEPGDHEKQFTQVIQIVWPDKTEFGRNQLSVHFKQEKPHHQTRLTISGFPIGQPGSVELNTWLEAESQRISETYSWTITVEYAPLPQSRASSDQKSNSSPPPA